MDNDRIRQAYPKLAIAREDKRCREKSAFSLPVKYLFLSVSLVTF